MLLLLLLLPCLSVYVMRWCACDCGETAHHNCLVQAVD